MTGERPDVPAGLPVLRGLRVTLRPTARRDVLTLAAILAEPAVAEWWCRYDASRVRSELVARRGQQVWAIEVDRRVLLRPLPVDPGSPTGDTAGWTLDDAGPPIVVGAIQAYEEEDPDYRHAAIDLFLATACHGLGLGPEAIRLLAAWLIDVRGHHRISIDPAADNVAAIRAYRKVGFAPVGRLRAYERGADGEWHDGLLMELLAADLVRQAP